MRLFSLCRFARFETVILSLPSIWFDLNLQNFKKPLDIFSPQIERKRCKEYLVIILPAKESLERFSCLKFIFEKSKPREAGLSFKREDSGFLETLLSLSSLMKIVVSVYVSPNYISFIDC